MRHSSEQWRSASRRSARTILTTTLRAEHWEAQHCTPLASLASKIRLMTTASSPLRRFFAMDIASRAATLSFGSNLVLMIVKIAVGLVFGSVAVLGDGIDSAEDVFASALAFFAVRLDTTCRRAPSFGHGKAEGWPRWRKRLYAGSAAFIAASASPVRQAAWNPYRRSDHHAVTVSATGEVGALRAARISGSVAIASTRGTC
jgi:hypothetical protein